MRGWWGTVGSGETSGGEAGEGEGAYEGPSAGGRVGGRVGPGGSSLPSNAATSLRWHGAAASFKGRPCLPHDRAWRATAGQRET